MLSGWKDGAQGRNRTGTVLLPRDFKSLASTNFATWADGLTSLTFSILKHTLIARFLRSFTDLLSSTTLVLPAHRHQFRHLGRWSYKSNILKRKWRLRPESNRHLRICNPLYSLSTTQPSASI